MIASAVHQVQARFFALMRERKGKRPSHGKGGAEKDAVGKGRHDISYVNITARIAGKKGVERVETRVPFHDGKEPDLP
jgi:hypothetical protein